MPLLVLLPLLSLLLALSPPSVLADDAAGNGTSSEEEVIPNVNVNTLPCNRTEYELWAEERFEGLELNKVRRWERSLTGGGIEEYEFSERSFPFPPRFLNLPPLSFSFTLVASLPHSLHCQIIEETDLRWWDITKFDNTAVGDFVLKVSGDKRRGAREGKRARCLREKRELSLRQGRGGGGEVANVLVWLALQFKAVACDCGEI